MARCKIPKNIVPAFILGVLCLLQTWTIGKETIEPSKQLQEKPAWLQTCKRENPNENDCFRKLFEGCFPALAAGIPEMGVKNFEPLRIDEVTVAKGCGNLVLSGGFQNLVIRGPSNSTVRKANLDLIGKKMDFELAIPLLRIRAKYNLRGNILLLPLIGSGNVTMALKDVKTAVYTKILLKNEPEVI